MEFTLHSRKIGGRDEVGENGDESTGDTARMEASRAFTVYVRDNMKNP